MVLIGFHLFVVCVPSSSIVSCFYYALFVLSTCSLWPSPVEMHERGDIDVTCIKYRVGMTCEWMQTEGYTYRFTAYLV
jgi:hypothetical protein